MYTYTYICICVYISSSPAPKAESSSRPCRGLNCGSSDHGEPDSRGRLPAPSSGP